MPCWIDKLSVEIATIVIEMLAPASPVDLRLAEIVNADGTTEIGVTADPSAALPEDLLALRQVSRRYKTIAENVLKTTVNWAVLPTTGALPSFFRHDADADLASIVRQSRHLRLTGAEEMRWQWQGQAGMYVVPTFQEWTIFLEQRQGRVVKNYIQSIATDHRYWQDVARLINHRLLARVQWRLRHMVTANNIGQGMQPGFYTPANLHALMRVTLRPGVFNPAPAAFSPGILGTFITPPRANNVHDLFVAEMQDRFTDCGAQPCARCQQRANNLEAVMAQTLEQYLNQPPFFHGTPGLAIHLFVAGPHT